MKKLAVFVEGQTEQIFVHKLLIEIAGDKNIVIQELKSRISTKGNRSFTVINAFSAITSQEYFVATYDSGSDSTVQSDIRDNYDILSRQNFDKIIGLRDVYPISSADIPQLERGLRYKIKTVPILVSIILAIREVEAWFLAETTHFPKIHHSLTLEVISRHLNFDPSVQDVEGRAHPSGDLDSVYHLAGCAYTKKKANCLRTVNALDYSFLYLALNQRIGSLGRFIQEIDNFLS